MPDPVPPGRFAEYAACISEGFCPSCRQQFRHAWSPAQGITWGICRTCACGWDYDRLPVVPVICWRGEVDGIGWEIIASDHGHVHGTAEWAE